MLIRIHPEDPAPRLISQVVDILKDGGIIIYPTDTVYGIGCDMFNRKAVEKVCNIKGIKPEKANFSVICHDLSHISDFTRHFDNHTFKLMKKYLPGPFTFILPANNNIPKLFRSKKKTVGIRIPDNNIALEIVKKLGNPILNSSIHDSDEIIEYTTDPELIYESYENKVAAVINGGFGNNVPSTIIDCSDGDATVVRQGLGIYEN